MCNVCTQHLHPGQLTLHGFLSPRLSFDLNMVGTLNSDVLSDDISTSGHGA